LEAKMFLLLPLIGNLLIGRLAARRVAIPVAVVLFLAGAAVFASTAPDHETSYSDAIILCLPAALVCAGTLLLGMWLRRRAGAAASTRTTP
jgi:protein-S-isoprenylcysteine O-methyltransferase Ste14